MKEDYLWDKTGEPDPEIQQLEETLGTLRYQPKALTIPAGLRVGRQRNFFRDFGPRLAIAATIAMLLFGLGLWFGLQRLRHQPGEVVKTPDIPVMNGGQTPAAVPSPNQSPNLANLPREKRIEAPHRHRSNQSVLAENSSRLRKGVVKDAQLAMNKQDGEAAKDQLMLALRLTGAKLSFAQKKMQNTNPRDLIHNQHKIG